MNDKISELIPRVSDTKEETNQLSKPISAIEIMTTEWPVTEMIIPGLLPIGLSILAGKPKIGKSWLGLQIATAVGSGGVILGEQVEKRSVLYIAYEDPGRRLFERLRMQKTPIDDDMLVDFYPIETAQQEFGDLRNGGASKVSQLISANMYQLVLIDTLSKGIHGDYNDNNVMTKALTPMHAIANEHNSAIVFIDHHRKRSQVNPDAIIDIIGGTAKAAVIDTIWGIYSNQGVYNLEIVGRDVEQKFLIVEFDSDTCTWELKEGNSKNPVSTCKREIIVALRGLETATNKEIADAVGRDKANVYKDLIKLHQENLIERIQIGESYLYSLALGKSEEQ